MMSGLRSFGIGVALGQMGLHISVWEPTRADVDEIPS
jgi:hypothetical protein